MSELPPFGRSAWDSAEAERFFYPGTTVLKNRLRITVQAELDRVEAQLFANRLARWPQTPIRTYYTSRRKF
jgi:fido (protein-threonine AMPylation protein)